MLHRMIYTTFSSSEEFMLPHRLRGSISMNIITKSNTEVYHSKAFHQELNDLNFYSRIKLELL